MIEDINTFRRQDEYKYNMMELIKIDQNDNDDYFEQLDIQKISKMPIELPQVMR